MHNQYWPPGTLIGQLSELSHQIFTAIYRKTITCTRYRFI